jgi:tetratricopeptide (TPR) repeat protein
MRRPANSVIDPATAREIALRSGAARVIFGAVSRVGDSYNLDVEIEQPDNSPDRMHTQWTRHWTWTPSSPADNKTIPTEFLAAVRDSSEWIRSQFGESANDIARMDTPPQDVTTANWEALSEFAQAEKFYADAKPDSAVVALGNAVNADPHFALAYARLGDVLVSLNRYEEGYGAYRSALAEEQQQRLTRRERDGLKGIYASDARDFSTALTAFTDYTIYYPNDYLGWFYRAYPLRMMGRVEEAITSLRKAEAIDPQRMPAPAGIARYGLILNDFPSSSRWVQHLRNYGHDLDADLIEGESAFLLGSYNQAESSFQN